MRKPWEVLELALSLLDEYEDSYFMCNHLDWLEMKGLITQEEKFATRTVVMSSIKGYSALSGYLTSIGVKSYLILADAPEYRPYQVEFYTNLIATLKQE